MPYTGTVSFTDNEANHPNGHFCLIGDDGKPYIAGVSDRGGISRVVVGSIELALGDIFVVDETKWQADFAQWRTDNLVTIPGTFFMGQEGFPIQGTPFFYVAGYQQAGGPGSTLAAYTALCCWLRYRIVDAETLTLDGVLIYKTGPSPAFEALTNVNWSFCCSAPIDGKVYAIAILAFGVALNINGSGNTGIGSFLIELPLSGSVVNLTDNIWQQHVTRFPNDYDFQWNSGEENRLEVAIYKVAGGNIGILTYQMDGENPGAVIDTSGCEYWEVNDAGSFVITQSDKRSEFGQPWDDSGTLYGGAPSDVIASYLDDYGAPVVNPLPSGKNELVFGRTFSDDLGIARFRRYIQDPLTNAITFDRIYEVVIPGATNQGPGALAFLVPGSDEIITAIAWNSWQNWTLGNLEATTPDVCIDTLSGFRDENLALEELACDAEWPIDDLKPRDISIIPVQQSISGGPTAGGDEPVEVAEDPAAFPESSPSISPSIAGFWRLQYGNVQIRTLQQVRKWRQTQALLNGRQGVCCVPFNDGKRAPWQGGVVAAHAASSAAIGDTDIDIEVTVGGALEIGMHFSAGEEGHERAYRIVEVNSPGSPSIVSCAIWPPVRTAIDELDPLEFEHPICRMRLAKDDGMSVQLDLMRFAEPSVDWVEDI